MGIGALQFFAGIGSGIGGGLLAGLFGVGGAVILIPLMACLLKLDQHRAQGLALAALLLPNGLPAVLHYRRRGVPIHWKLVGFMTIGFMGGIWGGAKIANHIPSTPLRYGFVALLVFLALRMIFLKDSKDTPKEGPLSLDWSVWLPGILIGTAGGLASGLLGIGGAILMNPLMVWRLKLPQHQAQLTSLALMLPPIGLPGVIVYAQSQRGLPWIILAGVALGFLIGAYLGAHAATRIQGSRLRKIFAGVMLLMAVMMLIR